MTSRLPCRKKLIEVDLPLDAINEESAREKPNDSSHPANLHKWWARRPLAACRAVIFASLVDDPSSCPEEYATSKLQREERERLHDIIRRLVAWKNNSDESVLGEARYEIARSLARSRNERPPEHGEVLTYLRHRAQPIYDPFCGRGSIPLEAHRLGLRAIGSDLNPVAVLITKALIELAPKFANRPPVNPDADPMGMNVGKGNKARQLPWRGAAGLANDIRYYGRKIREMAWERVGHYYPNAKLSNGGEALVIAWLWARTVPCPNPACGVAMPMVKTFQLSSKSNNRYWTRPIVDRAARTISFKVQDHNDGVPAGGTVNRSAVTCVACRSAFPLSYVREQASAGNMDEQMTAIVAEGDHKRLFLSPDEEHVQAALEAEPAWRPFGNLPEKALGFRVQRYGFTKWHQLFTNRQLVASTTFSDLHSDARQLMNFHGASQDDSDAISTYLALVISKITQGNCAFSRWRKDTNSVEGLFGRQTLSMIWDFAETNPFSNSTQNWLSHIERVAKSVEHIPTYVNTATAYQADAATSIHINHGPVIITDPPYYDQIGYADLSDFFYVWLRPMLRDVYPELFAGIMTPKAEEMVANPRFDDPRKRFEDLLGDTLKLIRQHCTDNFPSSIFYAHKQQEERHGDRTSTGWETMLSAVVSANLEVVGTWPFLTELSTRQRAQGSNVLETSIVLVCRPRPENARVATRRQFLDALEAELPVALDQLTRESHIAPVDLAQAAIGPGMQIYSRYRKVETIGGDPVPVREALAAIRRVIAEYDQREQGELDSPTRFCLDWLRQYGNDEGPYNDAHTLARANNVSVEELRDSRGLLTAVGGAVSLLPIDEYGPDRRPRLGEMTAWEGACRMAYHLSWEDGRGVVGAADVAAGMGSNVESVERLARILYNHYDRKGDSRNSVLFNNLVVEWPNILARMQAPEQGRMI